MPRAEFYSMRLLNCAGSGASARNRPGRRTGHLASFSQFGTEQDLTAPGVNNLASYPVGRGQFTSLSVDTDGARELEAIALAFAGKTGKRGVSADAIQVGFGTPAHYAGVSCTGKTAVAMRGGTSFGDKALAAMDIESIGMTADLWRTRRGRCCARACAEMFCAID